MDSTMKPASISGRTTPTSREFAEQIRLLEEQGDRLIQATTNSRDLDKSNSPPSQRVQRTGLDIGSLTDISDEQRTLSALTEQLDLQGREAERRHQSLYGTSRPLPLNTQPSVLSNLEIPLTSSTRTSSFNNSNNRQPLVTVSTLSEETTVERTNNPIRESRLQQEIKDLKAQLAESLHVSSMQRAEFKQTHIDLKAQLQETAAARDAALHKLRYDNKVQAAIIQRLQRSLEEV